MRWFRITRGVSEEEVIEFPMAKYRNNHDSEENMTEKKWGKKNISLLFQSKPHPPPPRWGRARILLNAVEFILGGGEGRRIVAGDVEKGHCSLRRVFRTVWTSLFAFFFSTTVFFLCLDFFFFFFFCHLVQWIIVIYRVRSENSMLDSRV